MEDAKKLLCEQLIEAGIDTIFGLPGGATQFIFDTVYDYRDKLDVITVRQENAATCAADGYARASGKLAVAMGQGPFMGCYGGFGIMEAFMASTPMLVITENSDWNGFGQKGSIQCSSGEYGSIDLVALFKSFSKYVSHATTGKEVVQGVQYAIKHATTGRPGPAVVIGKWQACNQEVDLESAPRFAISKGFTTPWPSAAPEEAVKEAAKMLREAAKPVIIAGNGVHASKSYEVLLKLAHAVPAPVATTYKGKSTIAETEPLALGTLGLIGQQTANQYISEADVVLVLGSRLSPPNDIMMENPGLLCGERQKIIQVDIEPRNIGWTKPVFLGLNGDVGLVMGQLMAALKNAPNPVKEIEEIQEIVAKTKADYKYFKDDNYDSHEDPILPERMVKVLSDAVDPETNVVLDAGNNRMFMANGFVSKRPGSVFCAGGIAGVGWGPLAAIGVKKAQPERKCVVVVGDGGFAMSSHAVTTAVQHNLPLIMIVMNNNALGNVRDYQGSRIIASEYPEIDFSALAKAYGADGRKVEKESELQAAVDVALASEGTYVLDVAISRDHPVTTLTKWV